MRPRWAPQSSKLLICRLMDGRFDSDTFPQMRAALLITLTCCVPLWSQLPKLFQDGEDWRRLQTMTQEYPEFALPMKRAYLSGFLDGKYYYFLQVQAGDSAAAAQLFGDYLNHFSMDELIRGTDEFYNDPTNIYLPIVTALTITSLRAKGFPDSVVAEYTAAARDWINTLTEMYSHEVPVTVEGISQPRMPISIEELMRVKVPNIRKWYRPGKLVLP